MYITGNSLDVVKLLLDKGANPFDVDNNGKDVIYHCRVKGCRDLISEYIWKNLYKRDVDIAQRYSKQTSLPKDIWTLILLNKRQQLLCQNLSSSKNKEVLRFFAMELEIPITNDMTKGQLCGIISRQLAYGKGYKGVAEEINRYKKQILMLAKKFNIDTNQTIEKILVDLSKIF